MAGENEAYSELHTHQHGPSVMVKQDHLKYFRMEGKGWPEQLFDLAADPDENRNLIDDDAVRRRSEAIARQSRLLQLQIKMFARYRR